MQNIEQWVPEAQAAFIERMRRPEAYPLHPAPAPILCIETHISWVFLAGRFAYKVKKPVRLSFLDYSTAARREASCREELRLNQRYAPGLYVGVAPIGGSPAEPRVGDESTPAFEHAVQMLRFEAQDELAVLLEHGQVTNTDMRLLGRDIATLHAGAGPAADESGYGAPERIHRVTLDNFAELDRTGLQPDRLRLEALRNGLYGIYERRRALMQSRLRARRVRECHGDLHCGNVVRWHGHLVPFDGLEFDPALRFIDVASDIAFLSMDLAARGHAGLRRELLNSWTETSGDFEAVELLQYYESYRALVRAKVAALRSKGAELQRYLDWACEHARPRRPLLVLMVGLSGSGKTWLAQRLATRLDAFHVRSDIERKRLAGIAPLQSSASPPDAGIYTLAFNRRTYARLDECASHCLAGGENVIVDAASLRRAERIAVAELAARSGAEFRMIHCTAPLATLKERVAARGQAGSDASEATVELLERQPSYWEPFVDGELASVVPADTRDAGVVETVVAAIKPAVQAEE